MKTVDQVKQNSELTVEKWRRFDKTLKEETLFRDRESVELPLPPALADPGTESLDVSWVSKPSRLGGLINVEDISSVIPFHKVGNFKDQPGLSRRAGDRNLYYISLSSTAVGSGLSSENKTRGFDARSSSYSGVHRPWLGAQLLLLRERFARFAFEHLRLHDM